MNSSKGHETVSNFFALAFAQYGSMFCSMFFSLWLTRLLLPADFGLVAIGLFYFSSFNWITEWGWEQGLIAHKEIPVESAASTHFLIRFVLGFLPLVLFTIGYPWFKTFLFIGQYKILLLLAVAYWIEKMSYTYRSLLERENRLKNLAAFEILAIILSFSLALLAAQKGAGVVSLVIQRLAEKTVLLVGYWWSSSWKFGISFSFKVVTIFFKTFGFATWLGAVFGLALYDFMPFLIGNIKGPSEAGLYVKAFTLGTFPLMLTAIFSRLTTPLYTRYQMQNNEIRAVFFKAQILKFCMIFPLQLFLVVTADIWIAHLFGAPWVPMIPLYRLMALYGFCRAFFDDVPNLFSYGFKNPWVLTQNQILQSVVILSFGPFLIYKIGGLGGAITSVFSMMVGMVLIWLVVWKKLFCSKKIVIMTLYELYEQAKVLVLKGLRRS